MTNDLLKDQNYFHFSVPPYFVNNTPGDFDYDYISLIKYFLGTGDLKVTLSGEIDQTALDSGINEHKFAYVKSVRTSLWSTINKIGYAQDDSTYFNFLAVTNQIDSILKDGTVIDVPVFFLGSGSGDPAKITINGGIVELKGQTIIDSDHVPNIEIDINNSSTFTIDKAFKIAGTFNINGGNFIFEGDAPDSDTSIVLTKTDGSKATYQTNKDEVVYNNSNSSGITYNEENITNSTINLTNGSISTGKSGVIFLDHHNQLNLSGDSAIDGKVILGWDQNAINVAGNFIMRTGSDILYTGSIDFKNYGFSGSGYVSIFGQYWDGKEFKLSQAFVEGGTLGNLNIGYDPFYNQGLGGLTTTSDSDAPMNNDVLYGGNLTVSGNTTLEGTVIMGGEVNGHSTVTLKNNTNITLKNNSRGFVLMDFFSYFIAENSVNFNTLDLQQGTVKLGDNDSFTELTAEDGTLTTSSGTVTGTNLTQTGGNLTFDTLIINNNLNILGTNMGIGGQGILRVNDLECKQGELYIGKQGLVITSGGTLDEIVCDLGSQANLDNTTINTLITKPETSDILLNNCSIVKNLSISYGSTVSVTGNLNYAGSDITVGLKDGASTTGPILSINGGAINFTSGKCFIETYCTINGTGTFQVNNGGVLVVSSQSFELYGRLNLTGSGTVFLSDLYNENGSIYVNSGVTLGLTTASYIKPTINLNSGSVLDIGDVRGTTTNIINFMNETSDQITTIEFDNSFSNKETTINKVINNIGTSDRIDFKGINFSNETFHDAVYSDGKLTVIYTDKGKTTTHEIVLNGISSSTFTDGETFKIINDGKGGSEIDFSTGKVSSNPTPLHSMFHAGNDHALTDNVFKTGIHDNPGDHTAVVNDFSSAINHTKELFNATPLDVTHDQFSQPNGFLGTDNLLQGTLNQTHNLVPHLNRLCA